MAGAGRRILGTDQNSVRDAQETQIVCDLRHTDHAPANHNHFPAKLLGQLDNLLEAVNGGTEAGDQQALFRAVEDILKPRTNGSLGFRIPRTVGIGGIGEQQQNSPLAIVGKGMQVKQFVIGGGGIDFEIARVNHHPKGGGDGQRDGANDGMGNMNELHFERADFHYLLRLNAVKLNFLFKIELFESPFDKGASESGGIDWNVKVAQEVCDGAYVILVAVGQDQSPDMLLVLTQEGQIRGHDVDAHQLILGEHHAAVDDDDVVAVA